MEITHRARTKNQLNRGFVGPFLTQGIVIPDQNQGDWRLSCHFNPSAEVWGCAFNNQPWRLPAAGNQRRGRVWGCCSGQSCLKLVSLKTVLFWSIFLSSIWMETGKLKKIRKQKSCRTTRSASACFALLSGTVGTARLSRRAASSRLQGTTQPKINDLCLLRVVPAVFWYLWNLIIDVCNRGCTNSDFINKFTWMFFIYHFLLHPSFFSLFPSPQPPQDSRIQDCL